MYVRDIRFRKLYCQFDSNSNLGHELKSRKNKSNRKISNNETFKHKTYIKSRRIHMPKIVEIFPKAQNSKHRHLCSLDNFLKNHASILWTNKPKAAKSVPTLRLKTLKGRPFGVNKTSGFFLENLYPVAQQLSIGALKKFVRVLYVIKSVGNSFAKKSLKRKMVWGYQQHLQKNGIGNGKFRVSRKNQGGGIRNLSVYLYRKL